MRYEIRIAGYGGQGIITAGYVLANAISIHDSKYASMTQSYGPEARGGACKSDIILADEPIDYPKPGEVDCLVALSLDAYLTFYSYVKQRGIVLYESNLVTIPETAMRRDLEYFGVAAVEAAKEIGNLLTANIVMLGTLQAITEKFTLEALKESIIERFPKYKDINLKAVEKGVELTR